MVDLGVRYGIPVPVPNTDEPVPKDKPAPPLPEAMEELDRLKLENAQLRVMAQQRYYEGLLPVLREAKEKEDKLREEYMALLKKMGEKYQFDYRTDSMDADTGVIRRGFHPDSPPE